MAVRPFHLVDVAAVNALLGAAGWPQRSPEGWRWLDGSPALRDLGAPAGWVLEDRAGAVAGFVGNWVQRFVRGGEADRFGASGFSLVVGPQGRGGAQALIRTVMNQPGVFAAYTLNANPRAARFYPRMGLRPWPEATHDRKLSWVVAPGVCLAGRAWRALADRAPNLAVRLGERMMNPRLGERPRLALPRGVAVLTDLRDRSRWADFWTALKVEGGLTADRSPAAMRWRLADPDLATPPLMLVFNRGPRITGYAMAMLGKDSIVAPPSLEIIDLMALNGEAEAVPLLMQALREAAPLLGAAKMRLQVVTPGLMQALGPWAASARREGGWGHGHARFNEDAPDPSLWAPTPFDGDYALCLRPPPVGAAAGRPATLPAAEAAKA